MRALTVLLGSTLLALASVHVYWGVSGAAARVAIPTTSDGRAVLQPSAAASLSVACALFVAAGFVMALGHFVTLPLSDRWIRIGNWAVALAFALRTIGDFRYVGLGRRVRGTRFARWDMWLFTPLCLLLAVGIALLATV